MLQLTSGKESLHSLLVAALWVLILLPRSLGVVARGSEPRRLPLPSVRDERYRRPLPASSASSSERRAVRRHAEGRADETDSGLSLHGSGATKVVLTHNGEFAAKASREEGTVNSLGSAAAPVDVSPAAGRVLGEGGVVGASSGALSSRGWPLRLKRSNDVYHSLDEEPKFLGMPLRLVEKRAQTTHALDKVCVADAVGGAQMAADAAFQRQAQRGHRAAASKSVIFAGLLRDIGDSASILLNTLRHVGNSFARYHIIVLENNSQDSTKTDLGKECEAKDTWCFELDLPKLDKPQDQKNPSRVEHLAMLRQRLLEQVRRFASLSPAGSSWDFLVHFDGDLFADGAEGFEPSMLDALLGFPADAAPQEDSLASILGLPFFAPASLPEASAVLAEAPWDVICANQLANFPKPGRYRDTFAFRRSSWRESQLLNDDQSIYFSGNQLIPVKSCFSGLAIYSMRAIYGSGCNYTFEDESVCEHVTFHRCLANQGYSKVAIYPPLTNRANDAGVVGQSCVKLGHTAAEATSMLQVASAPGAHAAGLSRQLMRN